MKKLLDNSNLIIGACPQCGAELDPPHAGMVYCSDMDCSYQIDAEELLEIQGDSVPENE